MAIVPDSKIEEIRRRADIVEVVQTHTRLKKAGRNWVGLCPFHQEKTPSFNVNPDLQIFKCFGCQRGGDVFRFVMDANGLSFPEALKMLAERYGVEVHFQEGAARSTRGSREELLRSTTRPRRSTTNFFSRRTADARRATIWKNAA
ncbi:MAG: CHC2 zinc finger domain-containing protein [Deltaproteobacteria bacterium]|nr:CHC2 zinc finger domain-containing protein [Deltaproteobacteria bacterium]